MGPWPQYEWTLHARTAMTRFRGGILLLALAACSDTAGPEVPGLPEPARYAVQIVASAEFPVDSAVVRMEGPTPRTFSLVEGEEVVVDSLAPGAYTVAVEGWRDDMVAGFTEFEETFEAGDRQERPVTFEGVFAPEEVAATLDAGLIQLQWDSVPGAVEYVVEVRASPEAAASEFEGRTEETSLQIGPFEAGAYTVRVQAVDRFGNGGHPTEVPVTIAPDRFPVTVQVEEGGELPVGSVVSEPEGILCGDGNDQCQAEFPAGQEVVLKHVWPGVPQDPGGDMGTGFGGWAGDCSGFDSCVLTVDGPKEVVATAADELVTFGLLPWILSSRGFNVPAYVIWNLTWEEAGLTCRTFIGMDGANNPGSGGCRVQVAPGTRLTISSPVGPVDWWGWPGWGGPVEWCESVEGNTCHAVVTGSISSGPLVWDWSPPQGHSLLEVGRSEFGLVYSDVPGIYGVDPHGPGYPLVCGGPDLWLACSQVYPDGTTVTLTADPVEGYRFTGWTGAECSGAGPCEFVMDEWTRVEAAFEEITRPVLLPTEFCSDYPPDAIVTFEDYNLELAVRGHLELSLDDDLTCDTVATLDRLEVVGDIADLTGLQNLSGVATFGVLGTEVSDISLVRFLTNLTSAWFIESRVADISPLAGLTSLEFLDLGYSPSITDYTPLSSLTNLEILGFGGTGISDLSPLVPLTKLRELRLFETSLTDLGPLVGLASLSDVQLERNHAIRDVRPLIDNPGIGPDDRIDLRETFVSCDDIVRLEAKGATVQHDCLRITTQSLADAAVEVPYSTTLEVTGWVTEGSNGRWSVASGALPTGLGLADDGEISGTPVDAGTFDFTVEYSAERFDNVASAQKPLSLTVGSPLGAGFGLEQFSPIPAGTFQMGDGRGNARPIHTVNLTRDFYLQRTEVTQAQWQEIMGENPSRRSCELCPVDHVSWDDIQTFLSRLNSIYPDAGFRLPTEAEWEYAARAGTTGDFGGTGVLDEMGWYFENAGDRTHPVALKTANAWGLYDMHGNVKEWVQDLFSRTYYAESPPDDPMGPSCDRGGDQAPDGAPLKAGCNVEERQRVMRGGSWGGRPFDTRSAKRASSDPDWGGADFGFRLVRRSTR